MKDVGTSYDALVDLFETIERFLSRLNIYTRIPLMPAVSDNVIRFMVEVLSTLAMAVRQVKQGRLSQFCPSSFGSFTQLSR